MKFRFFLVIFAPLLLAVVTFVEWPISIQEATSKTFSTFEPNHNATGEIVDLTPQWNESEEHRSNEKKAVIGFDLSKIEQITYSLYIPKIAGHYKITLNDALLSSSAADERGRQRSASKLPKLITIPPGFLKHSNKLDIELNEIGSEIFGISGLYFGPKYRLEPLFNKALSTIGIGSLVAVITCSIMCVLSFMLWVTQRKTSSHNAHAKRYPIYFFAGLADLFLGIRVSNNIIHELDINPPAWEFLTDISQNLWMISIIFVTIFLARWRSKKLVVRATYAFAAISVISITVKHVSSVDFIHHIYWYTDFALLCFFTTYSAIYLIYGAQRRNNTLIIMGAILAINSLFGLRDYYLIDYLKDFKPYPLQQFSGILFEFALMYFVIIRFRTTNERLLSLNQDLEERLAKRENELIQAYEDAEEKSREQERTIERGKILKDMHDGVGSHISIAMQQLVSNTVAKEQILQTLRESLDHLKLSIDSLSIPSGDVTAMLANMRYRLQSRLSDSGIKLIWQVRQVGLLSSIDDHAMRQLQFVVYGALANVLQHAHCSQIKVELLAQDSGTLLRIEDNGRGFEVGDQLTASRGLHSMYERTSSIGGTLSVESSPGLTSVGIFLPSPVVA